MCSNFFAIAQSTSFTGVVKDVQETFSLPGVHVILTEKSDSLNKFGTTTNEEGKFRFDNVSKGYYLVKISFIGYKGAESYIEITDSLHLNFNLHPSPVNLTGINIEEKGPSMRQDGDTTFFKADHFLVDPNELAEELLLRLPGIYLENGKIMVNGELVNEIWVDGQPFFGNDPSMALKNLPAEIFKEIQIINRLSEQSQFTGIDDGNRIKTINLVTKPNRRNGAFGNVNGGIGSKNRYNTGVIYNSFKEKKRISITGGLNNINQQGQNPERAGGNIQEGNNRSNALGLNYNDLYAKKFKINGSYQFNNNNKIYGTSISRFYMAEKLQYNEDNHAENSLYNHRLNSRIEYSIDSSKSFLNTSSVSYNENKINNMLNGSFSLNNILISNSYSENKNFALGLNFANSLLYSQKFLKKGRLLMFKVNISSNNNKSVRNQSNIKETFEDNGEEIVNQDIFSNTNGINLLSDVSFIEPLGENSILKTIITSNYTNNYRTTQTYNVIPGKESYSDIDSSLSSRFFNKLFNNSAGFVYQYNKNKIKFGGGLKYQLSLLTGAEYIAEELMPEKHFENLLPEANLTYNSSKKTNLIFSYNTFTSPPGIHQLQHIVDNSNPLLIKIGNPDLNQNFTHKFNGRMNRVNSEKGRNMNININGNYVQNQIVTAVFTPSSDTILTNGFLLSKGMQLQKPVNLNGAFNIMPSVNFSLPFPFLKGNFNASTGMGMARNPSLVNYLKIFTKNYSANQRFSINSNYSKLFDFSFSYNINLNFVQNLMLQNQFNPFISQSSSLLFNFKPNSRLILHSSFNYNANLGLSTNFNQNFLLWNCAVSYRFLKSKTLELKVMVFDILNQNNNINRNVSEIYIEDRTTDILKRYTMVSVIYNFRSFRNKELEIE